MPSAVRNDHHLHKIKTLLEDHAFIYQSCQIFNVFFNKKTTCVRCNNEIRNAERYRYIWLLIFDKFKRDVISEVILNDTMKPIGQCSLEDFKTLIICFNSVNSIIKRRPARIKGQGLGAGADS